MLAATGCGTGGLEEAAALVRIGVELNGRVYTRTIPGLLVAQVDDQGVVVASGSPLQRTPDTAPYMLSVVFRSGSKHELSLAATAQLYEHDSLAFLITESSSQLPKPLAMKPFGDTTGKVELYGFEPFDLLVPASAQPTLSCRGHGEIDEGGRLKLDDVESNYQHALVCSSSGRFLGLGRWLITTDIIDQTLRNTVLRDHIKG
jgi:hypothetical protein